MFQLEHGFRMPAMSGKEYKGDDKLTMILPPYEFDADKWLPLSEGLKQRVALVEKNEESVPYAIHDDTYKVILDKLGSTDKALMSPLFDLTTEEFEDESASYYVLRNDRDQQNIRELYRILKSVLHFIYNSLIRRSLPVEEPILMLIDEIELALHPVAVSRFLDLLKEIVIEHPTLTVILTSHSPEAIRKISHNNMFMMEHDEANEGIIVTNPCYPSYAIRDVYVHDGYDYVILVEDLLAKYVVEDVIRRLNLNESRLINILPVGGWENVLKLQYQLYVSNAFGVGTQIFSILDGDAERNIPKEYSAYTHSYLPISSVEKYLHKIIVKKTNQKIKKRINDSFFSVQSLDNLLADYYSKDADKDNNGKKLYKRLVRNLSARGVSEQAFVKELCNIIVQYENFDKLENCCIYL